MDKSIKEIYKENLEKIRNDSFFSPYSVSINKNPDDDDLQQLEKNQEFFLRLPEPIQNKIIAPETKEKIKQIGDFFKLTLIQAGDVSRVIRKFYFGEIKIEDISKFLEKEIPTALETANEIANQVISKIINDESLGVNKNLLKISLKDALSQFPNLGEQLISSSGIKMRYFNAPVRPSIKNWISDYNEAMGVDKHGVMERGNYLFHSENGKRLTIEERQKVGEVLRSFDEDSMLLIDPQRQELVFNFPHKEVRIPAPSPNGGRDIGRGKEESPSAGFSMQKNFSAINKMPEVEVAKPAEKNFNTPKINAELSALGYQMPKNVATSNNNSVREARQPGINQYGTDGIVRESEKPKESFNVQEFVNGNRSVSNGQQAQANKLPDNQQSPNANRPTDINKPIASEKPLLNSNSDQTASKMDFSSPHKFPFEKKAEEKVSQDEQPKKPPVPRRSSFIITPHDDGPKISGNMIDLRIKN